jgi:signal peptidase II
MPLPLQNIVWPARQKKRGGLNAGSDLPMSFLCALAIVIFDQLSKFFVLKNLHPAESIPLIKNIFHLTLVFNSGAAFGIFKNQLFLFIAVAFLCVIFISFQLISCSQTLRAERIGLGLVLGGAVGNLIDRIRFGYVVDFLDFRVWPVFNLADSAITIGTLFLVYTLLRRKPQV